MGCCVSHAQTKQEEQKRDFETPQKDQAQQITPSPVESASPNKIAPRRRRQSSFAFASSVSASWTYGNENACESSNSIAEQLSRQRTSLTGTEPSSPYSKRGSMSSGRPSVTSTQRNSLSDGPSDLNTGASASFNQSSSFSAPEVKTENPLKVPTAFGPVIKSDSDEETKETN